MLEQTGWGRLTLSLSKTTTAAAGKREPLGGQSQPLEGDEQLADMVISTLSSSSFRVNGELNGVSLSLLLDTGSPVTLISDDIWENIVEKSGGSLSPWRGQQFVGVSGTPLAIKGCCQASLTLGNCKEPFPQQVVVVESLLSKGILGLDFLEGQDCRVDLAQRCLEVRSQNLAIPLMSNNVNHCPVGVKLLATAVLPPCSELEVLAGTKESVEDGSTWLLEEKSGKQNPVLVARAVVSPRNDQMVIRLLNPRPEAVTVYANSTVAELSQLDAVSIISTESRSAVGECSDSKKQALWEIVDSCNAELSHKEKQEFCELLLQYSNVFSESDGDLGRTDVLQHSISTGNAQPIHQATRRIPLPCKENRGHQDD